MLLILRLWSAENETRILYRHHWRQNMALFSPVNCARVLCSVQDGRE